MQSIKLNHKEALIVDVPEDAKIFKISGLNWLCCNSGIGWTPLEELPEGNWTIIGSLTNGIPDFDVREYVPCKVKNSYWDFLGLGYLCGTPSHSFKTLLQSQGAEKRGKQVILIKV